MTAVGATREMQEEIGREARSQMRRRSGCCSLVSAVVVALCLAPSTSASGAMPALDIPYFLPVDLSQLEISVTTNSVGGVARVLPAEAQDSVAWEFSRSVTVERAGTLSLRTVADPAAMREMRIPKASWSDVKATVELTESGMLAGINASAAGRGDDFLLAVAKFAGVAAGFWTGSPLMGATASTWKLQRQMVPLDRTAPPAPVCPPIEQLEAEGVPVEMQALVSLDPAGCAAFMKLREATAKVEAMRIERDALAEQLPGSSGTDLTTLNKKLQSYRLEVTYAEATQAQRRAALATVYDNFAAARCLGKKVQSAAFHELLALDRLPSAEALGWLAPGADLSRDAVARALAAGKWREMRTLFDRTGVVATLDGAPLAPIPSGSAAGAAEPASQIAWRQAVPVRVRIWTLAGEAAPAKKRGEDADACLPVTGEDPDAGAAAKLSFDAVLDVLHPDSPVRTLPIESKAFADRSLAITFDPRGRPRKIDTAGTSSGAGFARALAASAQGFRDEYDATLKKRVSIEESKRELALERLHDQITALEAQKKELDARAALLGAAGNFDDLVARQKLDSDLKLLEAQVALRTAEATAEQRVAIAELEKRVLETQKRLALLEAEQALEEAHRKR